MRNRQSEANGRTSEKYYQIKVKGELGSHWAVHFDGLEVAPQSGITTIAGLIPDQAALFGLLMLIRDLGLPLLQRGYPLRSPPKYPSPPQSPLRRLWLHLKGLLR